MIKHMSSCNYQNLDDLRNSNKIEMSNEVLAISY